MLTAAAAILALIPLTRNVFWGPMSAAMMGGLVVATFLTVTFLPALYAAWFGVTPPRPKGRGFGSRFARKTATRSLRLTPQPS
jgi:multidrug efflux pump